MKNDHEKLDSGFWSEGVNLFIVTIRKKNFSIDMCTTCTCQSTPLNCQCQSTVYCMCNNGNLTKSASKVSCTIDYGFLFDAYENAITDNDVETNPLCSIDFLMES